MLAGHPRLFAPPELELLSFNTLEERARAFPGQYSFWLEGALQALMGIKDWSVAESKRIVEECEREEWSTKQFYGLLQEWLGERVLIDKTPSYALDLEILKRAESYFDNALYIHLLRHPYGMIRSFEEAKLEQVFFTRFEHRFSSRELAELVWLISHQNILEFLKQIPAQRQHRVAFEDLVTKPASTLEAICSFLKLEFHPDMLQPYQERKRRMTENIYEHGRMLGDIKFHEHREIDSAVAERWRTHYTEDFLGEDTRRVAHSLGYRDLDGADVKPNGKSAASMSRPKTAVQTIRALPRGDVRLDEVLDELEQFSEDEVQAMLTREFEAGE
jgi:hypothetical protein